MSLLLNLLSYSSITSPKFCGEKEERSFSSIGRFSIQPEVNKDRSMTLTKSLQKLNTQKLNQVADKKTRVLHKLSHKIAIKCRKNYYTFFVILETLKKKNLYLQQDGQISSSIPKRLNCNKNQIEKERLQMVQIGINKIISLEEIRLFKQFEQSIKASLFKAIYFNGKYKKSLINLECVLFKIDRKKCFNQFFGKLKDFQTFSSKIDIFNMTINSILQTNKKGQILSLDKRIFKQFLKRLYKTYQSQVKIVKKECESIQTPKKLELNLETFQKDNQPTIKKQIKTMSKVIKFQNYESSINCPIIPISAVVQKHKSFQFNKAQTILKSLKVSSTLIQKGYDQIHSSEAQSKICNRLPLDRIYQNLADQYDKQIFMSRSKSSKQLQISNVSFISKNDMQMKKYGQFSDIYSSSVSCLQMLKSDSSVTTLSNYQLMRSTDSLFGSEAVNFKNSLIKQRQSLKSQSKTYCNKDDINTNIIPQNRFKKQKISMPKLEEKQIFPVEKKDRNKHKIDETYLRKRQKNSQFEQQINQTSFSHNKINIIDNSQKNQYLHNNTGFQYYFTSRNQKETIYPTRDISSGNIFQIHQEKHQTKPVRHKNFIKLLNSSRN